MVWIARWIPNGVEGQNLLVNVYICNMFYRWCHTHENYFVQGYMLWKRFVSEHNKAEIILSFWPDEEVRLDFSGKPTGKPTTEEMKNAIIRSKDLNDPDLLINAARAVITSDIIITKEKTFTYSNNWYLSE